MTTRETAQARALLADIRHEDGTLLRPISCGTLTVLQLLGNPIATWLDTEHADAAAAQAHLTELLTDRMTLGEFWYIHAVPLEGFVPDVVAGDLAAVRAAVIAFLMDKPAHDPAEVVLELMTEHQRVLATQWQVADKGGRSKNAQSPR